MQLDDAYIYIYIHIKQLTLHYIRQASYLFINLQMAYANITLLVTIDDLDMYPMMALDVVEFECYLYLTY